MKVLRYPHGQGHRSRRKKLRRQIHAAARKRFRAEMQERIDLYALTFVSRRHRRVALDRLVRYSCALVGWDVDDRHRLIVPRSYLAILSDLPLRKAKVVTQFHLWSRLQRWMKWYPRLRTDGCYSAAYERIFSYLTSTRYFLQAVCNRPKVWGAYLKAFVYAHEQGLRLLTFPATTLG